MSALGGSRDMTPSRSADEGRISTGSHRLPDQAGPESPPVVSGSQWRWTFWLRPDSASVYWPGRRKGQSTDSASSEGAGQGEGHRRRGQRHPWGEAPRICAGAPHSLHTAFQRGR